MQGNHNRHMTEGPTINGQSLFRHQWNSSKMDLSTSATAVQTA
jgi:hypothetical protein